MIYGLLMGQYILMFVKSYLPADEFIANTAEKLAISYTEYKTKKKIQYT